MSLPELYSNEYLIMQVSRDGITKKVFNEIRKTTGLSALKFASATHVTTRTIERKQEHEKLSPEASERAILIGKLYYEGEKLFGSKEKFFQWMDQPNLNLGSSRPIEMLDTVIGIDLVSDILIRIQHGMVA